MPGTVIVSASDAEAAAAAMVIVLVSCGAGHASFGVPNWRLLRTLLAVACLLVVYRQTRRTETTVYLGVPYPRRKTPDASLVQFVVEGTAGTYALRSRCVHDEASGRAAFALMSLVVPVVVFGARLALFKSGVPVKRIGATDASLVLGKVRPFPRTLALPGIGIQDEALRTGHAAFSLRMPGAGRRAGDTPSGGVEVRVVVGADTIFVMRMVYLIVRAFAGVGAIIPDVGSVAAETLAGQRVEIRMFGIT